MSENDIYCQSRKQTLIEQINKITGENDDYSDWTLKQLDIFHAKIVARYKTFQEKHEAENKGEKLTIGNSLLNLKMGEIPGQANQLIPGAPIANTLFGKRVNEL